MDVPQSKPVPSRRYHHKSRGGCQRCKARKVKCDENRPVCNNCHRHGVSCTYDQPADSPSDTGRLRSSRPSSRSPGSRDPSDRELETNFPVLFRTPGGVDIIDLPESKTRRLLELRLMHHCLSYVADPDHMRQMPAFVNPLWSVEATRIAVQHPNLLYALLSLTTSHVLRTGSEDPELLVAQQTYLSLALHEQRQAIARLNKQNADAICFASLFILVNAVAMLRDRSIDPYLPPTQWLLLGKGSKSVFNEALHSVDDYEPSNILQVINGPPPLYWEHLLFSRENRDALSHLLNLEDLLPTVAEGREEAETLDPETRAAYEDTIAYLGSIQIAIDNSEPFFAICRRVTAFALFVPKKFVDELEEHRPLALVVLAHYFALATKLEEVWYVGSTAKRELEAISKALPPEWDEHMHWPRAVAGLDS